MYLPLFVGVLRWPLFYVLFSFAIIFCNHLDDEERERAGCFDLIVFRMFCYCKCSVTLPHGAVGWSVVCECGLS